MGFSSLNFLNGYCSMGSLLDTLERRTFCPASFGGVLPKLERPSLGCQFISSWFVVNNVVNAVFGSFLLHDYSSFVSSSLFVQYFCGVLIKKVFALTARLFD